MTPETKIKISRNGINKAEYQLWQIAGLIKEGEILSSDHYWHEGMIAWKKLSESDIITQSINAKKKLEEIEVKTKKDIQKEQDEMKELFEKEVEIVTQVISGLIGGWGLITLFKAISGDPDGSAVRQTVLEQKQTNGLLLIILSFLIIIILKVSKKSK
jgi:hypothetical protein